MVEEKESAAFKAVLDPRIVEDLRVKMKWIQKVPQEELNQMFFDLCDFGMEEYIKSEKMLDPTKSRKEIMMDLYSKTNKRG